MADIPLRENLERSHPHWKCCGKNMAAAGEGSYDCPICGCIAHTRPRVDFIPCREHR